MTPKYWLIWSMEHLAWWAPNSNGYVTLAQDAGHYTYEEALEITIGANMSIHAEPNEAMVPAFDTEN